jgi:hypothetical protein
MEVIMKNLFVKGCYGAVLALTLAIGAHAQSSTQYKADIPFNFTADGERWEAGQYIVGPVSSNTSIRPLVLRKVKSSRASILGIAMAADNNRLEQGHLYFSQIDGRYSLAKVDTPTFAMKVKQTQRHSGLARDKVERIVAILIK